MPTDSKPTLLLVDGHSLAFRAFYALPVDSFQTSDGQHTNAIHGFISMLLSLIAKEKPTHIGVAFDLSRYSFRTKEYPEYKATRGETPAEFIGQVPLLQDALHAMNITTITKEDFEADDILATLATQGRQMGHRVLVVSGDRDTIQLVNDDVTLLYPSKQGVSELTRYDEAKVVERYGIRPEQYPDVAALVGETSDNLPGVPKVGEKTAVKWLNEYGSLDNILARREDIPGVVGANLREHADAVVRNRRLNRLVTDVELPVGPADLGMHPIDVDAVRNIFTKLEFRTLQERVLKLAGATRRAGNEGPSDSESNTSSRLTGGGDKATATLQIPAQAILLDEELRRWLERASESAADPVSIVTEMDASGVIGVGLATETECVFVPVGEVSQDTRYLWEWLSGEQPKFCHDAKAIVKGLGEIDVTVSNIVHDTQLAAWIRDPNLTAPSLSDLVSSQCGLDLPVRDSDALIDASPPLGGSTAWHLGVLARRQRAVMTAVELGLLVDIEIPTARALAHMEVRGVAVSARELSELSQELRTRSAHYQSTAFEIIGTEVNLSSPKQLQDVLFGQLQMPPTKKMKTGYSTDANALADLQLSHPHPFLDALLGYRETTKLNQMVETLSAAVRSDGRIHTSYVQTGTTTGRLSSANPNLQNIPIRTADGRRIREAFQVGGGFDVLLTADYSQIEMRVMAHFSEDQGLIEAFHSGEDLHRFVGSRVFGVRPEDVTPEMRTKVKAMSYGLAYGLSAFGLARQLRIDTSEAKTLMNDYFQRFGGVRDYLRSVVENARSSGYTETLFGRRRLFPDLTSGNHIARANAERQALNAPMQGTAADIMKIAMLRINEQLETEDFRSRLLLQVHDELVLEVVSDEEERVRDLVHHHMSTAAQLRVPLEVQMGVGRTWNEAAH